MDDQVTPEMLDNVIAVHEKHVRAINRLVIVFAALGVVQLVSVVLAFIKLT